MDTRDKTPMSYSVHDTAATYDEGLRAFMLGVYNYMASALALTGIFAYLAATWPPLVNALYRTTDGHVAGFSGLGLLVLFAPLVMVFLIGPAMSRMSLAGAQAYFWAFSILMGLSLSTIFFAYTGESIMRVFFITAIMFGSMSIWGYSTKRDLTGMGHFMTMGLFGVILAMIVNMFLHSSSLQYTISILSVVIFTGLTAYDTQKIKAIYYQVAGDSIAAGKSAIMGALALYLDFINLFLTMLRLFGDRR